MSKSYPKKSVYVFLTLDQLVINGYFNKHDPMPIYKRQLNLQFEQYILASAEAAKRYDVIFYKLKFSSEADKQFAEPLMYAIRRHFEEKKTEEQKTFNRFKRRNWVLLLLSVVVVILSHIFIPMFLNEEHGVSAGVSNTLEVFAWVIMWHPLDELIFNWNPHLKSICLLSKLATAELILIENEKKSVAVDTLRVVA